MTEIKHTPGPWTTRDYNTKTGSVWIDGGFVRNRSCGTVAEIYPLTNQDGNLALIAAAPDLLAYAKEVMAMLEEHGGSIVPHLIDTDQNAGQRLRDAIAKAESRS